MLNDIVERTTTYLFNNLVGGSFYIGLDPIKEYTKFYLIAEYLQQDVYNQTLSIDQYSKDQGNKKIGEDDETEENRWKRYERTVDHYNTLNFEKKIELLKRQQEEKEYREQRSQTTDKKKIKGNPNRYKGNELFEYQLGEFKVLDDIKQGKYESYNANLIYKRINSDKGYLNKMNFRQYSDYIDILRQEIADSDDKYKNIRYYKLEKRLGYELIKSILTSIRLSVEKEESRDRVIMDLIPLFRLPLIKERQKYAEVYWKLNKQEKKMWRMEIEGLIRFISYTINASKAEISKSGMKNIITDQDLKEFAQIYIYSSYENNYKQRKDFTSEDFKALMCKLDDKNIEVNKKVKNKISE